MFETLKKHLKGTGSTAGKPFALTTRDNNGKKLKKPIPLDRQQTLDRLSEVNKKIVKMGLIANKAMMDAKSITLGTEEALLLAKRCTMALEHCAKTSIQNDFIYGSIETCQDPRFMDRKHAIYGARLDEIATMLSSVVKQICKD